MKLCVIGIGMVGSQVKAWFKDALTYDTEKQSDTWEECLKADCFFVCVPTPYNEGQEYDLSYLEDAISKIPDGKIVVIKSTVNPGTTDYFQNKYPDKRFMFNPEFLTELSAKEDFFHPDMQILGVGKESYDLASKIMLMLPPAKCMRVVSLIDAEWIKKIRNSFYATKVIFFNQIYDIIGKTDGDYETIRSIIVEDPRIGNSHSFIFHKNYRGFGGACLPKDTYSLIDFAKKVEAKSSLLETVKDLNKEYENSNNRLSGVYRKTPIQGVSKK